MDQSATPMGKALATKDISPTLQAHPSLAFSKNGYTYRVETRGTHSTYTVSDGARTLALPIHWSAGAGEQTWILERDGHLYESLVSYYPAINGLDLTTGAEGFTPQTLEQALGREMTANDSKTCFNCHATHAVVDGKLDLASIKPGIACEHCHMGSNAHQADAIRGNFKTAPPPLEEMSAEQTSNFCGQCHRTWETVVVNHWRGEANVRFQPYRLANSKCFNGADPRIACTACHDPHQNVVRKQISYDPACLACHAPVLSDRSPFTPSKTASPAIAAAQAPVAKACPVAKANCVSCHMPKVTLPGGGGHLAFTDHEIRVVRPGDPYPN